MPKPKKSVGRPRKVKQEPLDKALTERVRCLGFGKEHTFRRLKGDIGNRLCGSCRQKKESYARSLCCFRGTAPIVFGVNLTED